MAKAIWSGAIAFGLVSIPVKMYTAVSESGLDFDLLDRQDKQRIRYRRINEKTGKEVAWEDIVKGFKKNDHYVVLTNNDFERAAPDKTKKISILAFVAEKEIDPIYYNGSYFLSPHKNNTEPYELLRAALQSTGMAGLGTFVLRNREHLCIIRVYHDVIALNRLYFDQEIRDPRKLNFPKKTEKPTTSEVKMAVSLIKSMSRKFDISGYKDDYTAALKRLINKKAKGKPIPAKKVKKLPREVSSLMAQLKASIEKSKPAPSAASG